MSSTSNAPNGEYDVVVVGAGAAGLSAGVAAGQRGSKTLVLEKGERPGGTTVMSIGTFSAAGTRRQRRRGIRDSPEAFFEDMYKFEPKSDNPMLRWLLAREAATTLDWLESLGVVFAGPILEPPHRVARMHPVMPNSRAYRDRLVAAARRHGVDIRTGTRVVDLVHSPGGRVSGVVFQDGAGESVAVARGGVVLASGDISGSESLRKRFLPPEPAASIPLNPLNTGDGQMLAERLGAELRAMDLVQGPQLRFPPAPVGSLPERLPTWPWLARLGSWFLATAPRWSVAPIAKGVLYASMQADRKVFAEGGLLVNTDGDRFCDEVTEANSLALQAGSRGYLIIDQRIADHFDHPPNHLSTAPSIAYAYFSDYVRSRPDIVQRAVDVTSLADRINVDARRLAAALASASTPLRPPLYALGPIIAHLTVTEGGISVDEQLRVLRPDGSVVDGLHAAGGCGQGGMHLKGLGLHIGWAHTSGRLAGEAAAAEALRGP